MAEDPKPPRDGKQGPPRRNPRRSALDMRVLSASIVADAESAPVKVPEPAADPDAIVAVPPAAPAAPAAAVARAAEPGRDDDDDLIVVPGSPTRFVWMLGAVALGLAVILGLAMPRAAKRVYKPAAAAVATPEPRPENAPRAETNGAPASTGHAKPASTSPTKDDPAIEMKDEPETAAKDDTSHGGSTSAVKDDSSKSDDSTSDDSRSDDSRSDDSRSDAKDDAKDEPAPRSGAKLDPKRAAEAELAYRDGEQRAAIGDTDGALKSLRRAADLNPGYAPTYRALGDVYAKRGETGKARSSYQRYLKLAPNAGDASKVRGRLEAL